MKDFIVNLTTREKALFIYVIICLLAMLFVLNNMYPALLALNLANLIILAYFTSNIDSRNRQRQDENLNIEPETLNEL